MGNSLFLDGLRSRLFGPRAVGDRTDEYVLTSPTRSVPYLASTMI